MKYLLDTNVVSECLKTAPDQSVLAGQEVIIGKGGKPIGKLVPYKGCQVPRRPGALRGKIKIGEGFDDLPQDIAKAFGVVDP